MARRKKTPEPVNHERWLVSYADFITLLFAFFTTLYAISTVDQSKAGSLVDSMRTAFNVSVFPGEAGATGSTPMDEASVAAVAGGASEVSVAVESAVGGTPTDFEALEAEIRKLAEEPGLLGRIEVRSTPRGVAISLAEAAFFESGRAELRPGARELLARVSAVLATREAFLWIEGHTDDRPVRGGRFGSNWELSTARATTVVAFLLDTGRFDPERLAASGYAEYRPVSTNDDEDGRARNRRVDVVVSPLELVLPSSEMPT